MCAVAVEGVARMDHNDNKHESYEQRLSEAVERMAYRMGGQFVPHQRWDDVVRAPSQREVQNIR